MTNGIVVLSLFDGAGIGLAALKEAGVPVKKYIASEVDKYAIQIAKKNHPEIIHVGDVRDLVYINGSLYKGKWDEEDQAVRLGAGHISDSLIHEGPIDLLIGGPPCQDLSVAGKMKGLNGSRSGLFFHFLRLKKQIQPGNFFMENVRMKSVWRDKISELVGVEPQLINSDLVSAQNRVRNYWTDIEYDMPEDRGIYLMDILEDDVDDKYNLSQKSIERLIKDGRISLGGNLSNKGNCRPTDKSSCLDANYYKGIDNHAQRKFVVQPCALRGRYYDGKIKQTLEVKDSNKANCITSAGKDSLVFFGGIEKGRRLDDGKILSRNYREGYRIYSSEGKAATLTAKSKGGPGGYSGLYLVVKEATKRGYIVVYDGECFDGTQMNSSTRRGRQMKYKSNAITTSNQFYRLVGLNIRRLTPIECERLQTWPDNYTEGVSNTQRYKMIGNGWNLATVAHIFKYINS